MSVVPDADPGGVDDGQGLSDDSRHLVVALGEELALVRRARGWARRVFVEQLRDELGIEVPVNTYACYEQGIRPCPLTRLVPFCRVLGVSAPDLLALTLQRAQEDLRYTGVRVDLHKLLAADADEGLVALQRWARNRLDTGQHGDGVAQMEWGLLQDLAVFLGVSEVQLLARVNVFAPEVTPQSGLQVYRVPRAAARR